MANIIYAIYKENIIPLVGGVNPTGIETGLAEYRNWKLCAMEESEFDKFSEFKLYPIPKSIAVGMVIANREKYYGNQEDLDGTMPAAIKATMVGKTEEELVLEALAKNYINKLDLKFVTRAKVRQFKDFEDDLSDTKLLIEFLLAYIAEDYSMKSDMQKASLPIKDLMESFLVAVSESDLRINVEKIMNKIPQIIKDEALIYKIVKSNYVDQLKKNS